MEFFTEITHWSWWIIGVLFIALKFFSSSSLFLWLSISAVITGIFLWLMPSMSLTIQWLIFSIQSVLSIFVWRKFFYHMAADTD